MVLGRPVGGGGGVLYYMRTSSREEMEKIRSVRESGSHNMINDETSLLHTHMEMIILKYDRLLSNCFIFIMFTRINI